MRHDIDPTEWARRQEGAGWHQIAVADHLIVNRPFPHVWVTAAALATATTHVREGMHWLAEQGISRVQLSPIGDAGLDLLARVVL